MKRKRLHFWILDRTRNHPVLHSAYLRTRARLRRHRREQKLQSGYRHIAHVVIERKRQRIEAEAS